MEKIEKNYGTIVLNVLYARKEKTYPVCVSKHDSYHEKQVILLMILNGEGWHYVAVKKSSLLRGITSKHHGDFHCLNFFCNRKKCESHKKVCKNKGFCNFVMPSEDTKILEFNQ